LSAFGTIIGYDVWRNADGSSTHAVLDKSGSLTRVFFGFSQNSGKVAIWNSTFYSLPNIRKCYSITMISGNTAAVDCYSK